MALIVGYECKTCGESCCIFCEFGVEVNPPIRCPYYEDNSAIWIEIMREEC